MKKLIGVVAVSMLAACTQRAGPAGAQGPVDMAAPAQAARPEAMPSAAAQATSTQPEAPDRAPDVVYVPTPEERVQAMLQMAQVRRGEKLYDLGCGDGRIAVAAARDYGARAVCIDIDPQRIREARENVRRNGVEHLVEVRQADLFETDFSDADVVALYLLPSLNEKLRPTLQRDLRNGARIVSHAFDMGDWAPDQQREVSGAQLYLWVIRK
jgi:precorrin-6B methylase 2